MGESGVGASAYISVAIAYIAMAIAYVAMTIAHYAMAIAHACMRPVIAVGGELAMAIGW